jgi:hypothetical protein
MAKKTPECNHGDLEAKIKDLERQLETRELEQTESNEALEDANTQLEIMRETANKYQAQVTRILKLTEGRTGVEGYGEKEEKGSEIACFSGENRQELRGWKVQLALKIAGKPRSFHTEQQKL